jgi:MoaA/NifB/PqqE/SkfB family radical SAM enzyme
MAWMTKFQALGKLPSLLVRGRFSYEFDGVPLVLERIPFKKATNLLKCGLDTIIPFDRHLGLPPSIQVEPTNICNLKCPLCPTGSKDGKREKGFMSLQMFRTILEEMGDILISVILYSWGEPFLNRELPDMIAECSARNILTITSTNGNCDLTKEDALRIVDAGLSVLVIALDGSNQEIYQRYRLGGDVEKVKHFASLIQEAKTRRGSEYPYTNLRAVVTRENEEDLENIEKIAHSLGMNMFSVKSLGDFTVNAPFNNFKPLRSNMQRYGKEGKASCSKPIFKCPYPFRQPTVFWDGTVVGCEFDYDLENPWGTLGEQSLAEIWNGSQAINLRKRLRKGENSASFCTICPYRDRDQNSSVLSYVEMQG